MRISRKKRPDKPLIPFYRRNEKITSPEVRVLAADNSNIGIMKIEAALALAAEREVDLVEINPKGEPPVCKLVGFAQFKYQKEKEARKQKAKMHVSELKGIRLSIRISEGDMIVRQAQAEKFLDRGDKVRIEIILRGREHGKADLAFETIRSFVALLSKKQAIKYEQDLSRQAGKVTAIIVKK